MIRYLVGEINYGGKILREEDKKILNAFIDELLSVEKATCDGLEPDIKASHYGIPPASQSFVRYLEFIQDLPHSDPVQIFGFSAAVEREHESRVTQKLLKEAAKETKMKMLYDNPLDIQVRDRYDLTIKEKCREMLKNLP